MNWLQAFNDMTDELMWQRPSLYLLIHMILLPRRVNQFFSTSRKRIAALYSPILGLANSNVVLASAKDYWPNKGFCG
jgi:hypothetical protein